MTEPWRCRRHKVLIAAGKNCPLCLAGEKKRKEANRKSHNEAKKRWRDKNHEKQNAYFRKYYKKRYHEDLEYKKKRYETTRKWLKKVLADPKKAKEMRAKLNAKHREWIQKVKDTPEFKEKNRQRSKEYYYKKKKLKA